MNSMIVIDAQFELDVREQFSNFAVTSQKAWTQHEKTLANAYASASQESNQLRAIIVVIERYIIESKPMPSVDILTKLRHPCYVFDARKLPSVADTIDAPTPRQRNKNQTKPS